MRITQATVLQLLAIPILSSEFKPLGQKRMCLPSQVANMTAGAMFSASWAQRPVTAANTPISPGTASKSTTRTVHVEKLLQFKKTDF